MTGFYKNHRSRARRIYRAFRRGGVYSRRTGYRFGRIKNRRIGFVR